MAKGKPTDEVESFKSALREALENCKGSRIEKGLAEKVLLTLQSASPSLKDQVTHDSECTSLVCQCIRYLLEQMEVLDSNTQTEFKIDMSLEPESLDRKIKKKNIYDIETGINESPEKRHGANWTESLSPDTAEGKQLKAIQRTFVVISICVEYFFETLSLILSFAGGKSSENIKLFVRENGVRLIIDAFNSFKMHTELFDGVAKTSSRYKVSAHRLKTMTMAVAKLLYEIMNAGTKVAKNMFLKSQGLTELKQSLLYHFKEENLEIVLLLLGILSVATSGEFSESNIKHTALINLLLHHFQTIFKRKDVTLVLLGPLLMSLRNLLMVSSQAYSVLHSMNVIPQFLQLIDYAHFNSKKSLKILTLGLLFDLQQLDPKLENLIISLIQSYTPMSMESLTIDPDAGGRNSREYISPVMRADSNELGLSTEESDVLGKPLPNIAQDRALEESPISNGIYDMYKGDYLELKATLKVLSKGGGFAPNLEENLENILDKLREDEVIRGLFIVDRLYVDVFFELLHGGNEAVVEKIWAILELLLASESGVKDHCMKRNIFQILFSNFEDFGSSVKRRILTVLQLLISQHPDAKKEARECGILEAMIDLCHSFQGVDLNAKIISLVIKVLYALIVDHDKNQGIFIEKQGLIMVQRHFINFAKILRFTNKRSSVAPLTNPYPNVIDFAAIDDNLQIFENLSVMICSLASRNELIQNDFKSLSFIDQSVEEMKGHLKHKIVDKKTVTVFRCFTNVLRSLLENNRSNQQFFCEKQQVSLVKSLLKHQNVHIKLKGLKLLFQVNLDFPAGREHYAVKGFLELLLAVFECLEPGKTGDPVPSARSIAGISAKPYDSHEKSTLPGLVEEKSVKESLAVDQEQPVTMEERLEACLFSLMSISSLCQGNQIAKDAICSLRGARTILGLISHKAFDSHQMVCFCLNTLIKDHPGNTQDIIKEDGYSKICDIFDKEESEEVELRAFQLMNNLGNYSVEATVDKITHALSSIAKNRPYYCNQDEFNFLNLSRSNYFFRYITGNVLEMDEHLKRLNVLEIHAKHHSLYNQKDRIDLIPTLDNAEKFLAVLNGIIYMQQERKMYYIKNYGFEHIISLLTIKEFNMNLLDCIFSITKNMTVDKKRAIQERARKDGLFQVLTQYLIWLNQLVKSIRQDRVHVYDIVTHHVGEKDDIAPVARDQFGSSPFRFDDDFGFGTEGNEGGHDTSQSKLLRNDSSSKGKTPSKFDPGETYEDITLSSSQRNILNALKDKKIDLEDEEAAKGFEQSQRFDFDETVDELTQLKVDIYSILDDVTVAHNYNSVALANCKNFLTTLISDCLNVEHLELKMKAGDVLLNVYQEPQLNEYLNKLGCKKVLLMLAKSAGKKYPATRDRSIKLLEKDQAEKQQQQV